MAASVAKAEKSGTARNSILLKYKIPNLLGGEKMKHTLVSAFLIRELLNLIALASVTKTIDYCCH